MTQAPPADALSTLADDKSSLAQVLGALAQVEQAATLPHRTKVGISASATLDMLGVFLRRHAALANTTAEIVQGNYDDPIADVELFTAAGVEHVVLAPFFDSLLPAFEARLAGLSPDLLSEKEAEVRARYRLTFAKARHFKTIFLCLYHRLGMCASADGNDPVGATVARFNQVLREEAAAFGNVRMIDMDDIIGAVGRDLAFDQRFYLRNKAPYTTVLLDRLASRIVRAGRGFGSYFYKVVVLDCDNTLWGGIVGEDLIGGIKLGPHDYPGNVFWRAQHELADLERNGILLCLCTKNNPADVDEVLRSPDMVLTDDKFALKKINWNDKPQNLREIAAELSLGLDSFIFLDDSEFECAAVRSQLPMVRTFQVPKALPDYPRVLAEIRALCLAGGVAADSRGKTQQYRTRAAAESLKAEFTSHEDYLKSLGLKVKLTRNARSSIARISELTQKSNQFNLTTRRYSEGEIRAAMDDPASAVYSLEVDDKFGSAGLTGVAVVTRDREVLEVDAFLMSCRVIGRGVENAIWRDIASQAAQDGCTRLEAEFRPTAKNAQVATFYDALGLELLWERDGVRRYGVALERLRSPCSPWIEVSYAG